MGYLTLDDLNGKENDLIGKIVENMKTIKEKAKYTKRISEPENQMNDEKSMNKTLKKKKDKVLKYLEILEITDPVYLMIPQTKRIPICRNGHTTCETCKR